MANSEHIVKIQEGATARWVTFIGARNLTVHQLCKAATLYEAELDHDHKELILRDYPHLLEEPDRSAQSASLQKL